MVFDYLGGGGGLAHERFDVQGCFVVGDAVDPDGGRRGAGDEQRAAVLIREDGGFVGADGARLLDDLGFVHAYERSEDGQGRALIHGCDV